MRKRLVAVVGILGLIPLLCTMAGGTQEQAAQAEEIVITGMVRNYTLNQEPPWYSAVETFTKSHPNVKIELEGLPYGEQREKVLITVGAGKGPDIAQVDCIWLGEFAANDIIIDVTDRLETNPNLRDDYLPVFAESAKWQGRSYGMWLYTDVRMFAWHKDFYRQAGMDPDDPPKTWSELRSFSKKVNRPDQGIWGYSFPAFSTDHTADRWYPFLHMGRNASILSEDLTRPAFNSQAGVDALQLLVDLMHTDQVVPTDLLGIQEGDVGKGFVAEKYAQNIKVGDFWGTYRDKGLSQEEYKAKIGMAPLPIPRGGRLATGSGGWISGITRDSENPDVVFEFLKEVVDAENMGAYLLMSGAIPTRKSMLAMQDKLLEAIPYFNVASEVLPHTHFRPPIPEYEKISAEIVTAIQKSLAREAPPKQALDAAAAQVETILAARKW